MRHTTKNEYSFDKGDAIFVIDVVKAQNTGCVFLQQPSNAVTCTTMIPSDCIVEVISARGHTIWKPTKQPETLALEDHHEVLSLIHI